MTPVMMNTFAIMTVAMMMPMMAAVSVTIVVFVINCIHTAFT